MYMHQVSIFASDTMHLTTLWIDVCPQKNSGLPVTAIEQSHHQDTEQFDLYVDHLKPAL